MQHDLQAEIRSAVERAYVVEREHGFLCLAAMRSDAAFLVVRRIVELRDCGIVAHCPPWLVAELYEWLQSYEESGKFGLVSNLGEADHSELMASLAKLLPRPESQGPCIKLQTREVPYPSGAVRLYYTYYQSESDGPEVLHGLYREYTETGVLRETEYTHGKQHGTTRLFGQGGRHIEEPFS